MSFYRSVLAAVAALAIASPVFADDTAANAAQNPAADQNAAPVAQQLADNNATATDQQNTTASDQQTVSNDKVNINSATAKDLMKVKGLNATKARAIVIYRKKHGEFKSLDELTKVKGFSKLKSSKLRQIQDQLTTG
jgi:competence protein ComEA